MNASDLWQVFWARPRTFQQIWDSDADELWAHQARVDADAPLRVLLWILLAAIVGILCLVTDYGRHISTPNPLAVLTGVAAAIRGLAPIHIREKS